MLTPPLTRTAETVLDKRYYSEDDKRNSASWRNLVDRVCNNIANVEWNNQNRDIEAYIAFREIMEPRVFVPNSPTLMNAGRRLQQLSACYVLPVGDDIEDIFDAIRRAAIIHKSGGGTGFAFSRLRPSGDVVGSTGGIASGPCSFLDVFDAATEAVKQGGTRRGANMAVLNVHHPDIFEFVRAKTTVSRWTNFNVSVGITTEFMDALRQGSHFNLRNPRTGEVVGERSAGALWAEIVRCAWETGDPGLVFLDRINQRHWNGHLGDIESTNPCGEQPLLPNESCNLGSIDLYKILGDLAPDDSEAWEAILRPVVATSTRFLDDVIDANLYPDLDVEEATKATRRIGLGVMGVADLLAMWNIEYDSATAIDICGELAETFVRLTLEASEDLGTERGPYPMANGLPYRNTSPNTIAPTGTISIIAGCSSGIEPIYKLAYTRHILDGTQITEFHPLFESIGRDEGWLTPEAVSRLLKGDPSGLPDEVVRRFPIAEDIPPEAHLAMQAAWQGPIDNAVSKTINLAHNVTADYIDRIYRLAYRSGLMGITVYRDQSRPTQVLTTPVTANLCPECFGTMIFSEGCMTCPNCFYSVCN